MNHTHRWMFLMAKGNYEPIPNPGGTTTYKFVEYAYLICNGPGHEPIVVKQVVEKLDEVDRVDATS